jgi:hydrogenase-4 component A
MNHFVIADPRRCIGCYTCMATCVENHIPAGLQAFPRLVVTHTRAGTMPIQCRHCEDAPCATVCPVRAITRKDNSIQINESLCIGCKLCGLACPFGAITPYGTVPYTHEIYSGQFAFKERYAEPALSYKQDGSLEAVHPFLEWNVGQKTVAIKCDLCYFSPDGPACVRICPTQALHLVDEQTMSEVEKAKRMKTASAVARGQL